MELIHTHKNLRKNNPIILIFYVYYFNKFYDIINNKIF